LAIKPIVLWKVIKVLGKPGEHDTEIHAILAVWFTAEFPIEVETLPKKLILR
jgi:ribonuclease R